MMGASDRFLLNPKNRAFVEGRAEHPVKEPGGCFFIFLPVFLIPFVGVGLFLVGLTVSEWRDYVALRTSGIVTDAEIVDRTVSVGDDGDTHYLHYAFTWEGERYTGKSPVDGTEYDSKVVGDWTDVRFSPAHPEISRLGSKVSIWKAVVLTGFSLFWNALVSVFVAVAVFALREKRIEARLRRTGRLLEGRLDAVSSHKDDDNDFHLEVTYRFLPPGSSQWVTGKSGAMRNDLKHAELPQPRTAVAILYADENTHCLL